MLEVEEQRKLAEVQDQFVVAQNFRRAIEDLQRGPDPAIRSHIRSAQAAYSANKQDFETLLNSFLDVSTCKLNINRSSLITRRRSLGWKRSRGDTAMTTQRNYRKAFAVAVVLNTILIGVFGYSGGVRTRSQRTGVHTQQAMRCRCKKRTLLTPIKRKPAGSALERSSTDSVDASVYR